MSKSPRRVMAAALIAACLLAAPAAASAESLTALPLNTSLSDAYVLNTSSGSLAFGNGATGSTPPTSTTVATSYASGSGTSGNVGSTGLILRCLSVRC